MPPGRAEMASGLARPERPDGGQHRDDPPGRADRQPAPGDSGRRAGRRIVRARSRVKRLDAELDKREPGDEEGRDAALAERDWLVAQLASAAGFGGRVRSFPDQGERARVAVGKAIRRALTRITEADPILGDHLRQTVHTGVRCSYWPS